jgi:prefoldin alpha subunit
MPYQNPHSLIHCVPKLTSALSSFPRPAVDITTLSVPQLRALQSRISAELEHLATSHAKLRAAQTRFRDCIRSINDGVAKNKAGGSGGGGAGEERNILVPLTTSLYVKGKLADSDKVLVDVGTGFFVEKVFMARHLRS